MSPTHSAEVLFLYGFETCMKCSRLLIMSVLRQHPKQGMLLYRDLNLDDSAKGSSINYVTRNI